MKKVLAGMILLLFGLVVVAHYRNNLGGELSEIKAYVSGEPAPKESDPVSREELYAAQMQTKQEMVDLFNGAFAKWLEDAYKKDITTLDSRLRNLENANAQ